MLLLYCKRGTNIYIIWISEVKFIVISSVIIFFSWLIIQSIRSQIIAKDHRCSLPNWGDVISCQTLYKYWSQTQRFSVDSNKKQEIAALKKLEPLNLEHFCVMVTNKNYSNSTFHRTTHSSQLTVSVKVIVSQTCMILSQNLTGE